MDEETRLRSMVQWYSTQMQGLTQQLCAAMVENAMLKEKLQKQAEEGGGDDAKVPARAKTG